MNKIITDKAEFMTEIAYLYDTICHPCTKERIALYKDVFTAAFQKDSIYVLDMGCCTGETALRISDERLHLAGIDISSGMIEEANQKNAALGNKVNFNVMNMKELMFEDGSFDIIYSNSLEWIDSKDDLEQVIKESVRCLKQGGLLLLDFPDSERYIKTCRPFYAECAPLEDGLIYKLTKYEKSDIGADLEATQTYIHMSGLEQYTFTGRLKWKLHTSDEVIEIAKKFNLSYNQTFYDYKVGMEGAFMQMIFYKGGY
ncbi:class I SAM-dependent methyltransferase [Anaerocolumna sp. MB42-C2]|uniref:class I SAM-dependent methyltransferase n=1 Tax=Anaerocolumna sp. MB42-C2 TaxID=3070997 RepID=UPI0027E1B51B|nr:class I SAM-dependent methyltransferase [Anaerocolumna sp. MB42-C2]WMJ86440.1 class I SAM-dependent methyltransferase [Anaerocolumna sp. MB42-C2]